LILASENTIVELYTSRVATDELHAAGEDMGMVCALAALCLENAAHTLVVCLRDVAGVQRASKDNPEMHTPLCGVGVVAYLRRLYAK
jgi:hypothetical protein